jgi:hypothetical protein
LKSVLDSAANHDIDVIIDFHRVHSDFQEPTPETGISLDDYILNVLNVLAEFQMYSNLIGTNAFNEYQGTDIIYMRGFKSRIFNAIEDSFPKRFHYFATGHSWGGSLSDFSLEDLPYADRITYSVHKYPFSGTADRTDWNATFGSLWPPQKLVIGEWGFKDADSEWARRFVAYLKEINVTNTCFWTLAYSRDTDGLWFDDCETVNQNKFDIIKSLWEEESI